MMKQLGKSINRDSGVEVDANDDSGVEVDANDKSFRHRTSSSTIRTRFVYVTTVAHVFPTSENKTGTIHILF